MGDALLCTNTKYWAVAPQGFLIHSFQTFMRDRGLVRVHTGRVQDQGYRHPKWAFIPFLLSNNAILRAWHHYNWDFHILKLSLYNI